jgi:lysophospholipase L1-like esterase
MMKFKLLHVEINKILLLSLLGILLCFVMPASASFAQVAPYYGEVGTGDLLLYAPTDGIDFFVGGYCTKIEQTGYIKKIDIYINEADTITEIRLKIWERDGETDYYNVLSTSEDFHSRLINGTQTITFDNPIYAKEGCNYGLYIVGGGSYQSGIKISRFDTSYADDDIESIAKWHMSGNLSRYEWDNMTLIGTKMNPHAITIKCYMDSPDIVFFGDSIISGTPNYMAYTKQWLSTYGDYPETYEKTIEYKVKALTGYTYQNMGRHGDVYPNLYDRFEVDVIAKAPKCAVIEGGVNNYAASAAYNKTAMLTYLRAQIDACNDNNIIPVVLLILPSYGYTNITESAAVDAYNAMVIDNYASSKDFILLDLRDDVGSYSSDGPDGNHWTLQSIYASDSVHYNEAGNTRLAECIVKNINGVYTGEGLTSRIYENGFVWNSREILPTDIYTGMSVIPASGSVNVTIKSWTGDSKTWTESSTTQQSVTHTIGGFPTNTDIQIKCDDINYATVTSNETGYIEWVYDGGFSEHTFSIEIECHDFNASLTSGAYPLTTQFTTSSDGIDAYYWDFENDGIIDSTKQNPAHTYGQTGDYSVNLTVHTSEGNVSTVKPDYITVSAPAFASDPVAWFNWVFSYLFGRF